MILAVKSFRDNTNNVPERLPVTQQTCICKRQDKSLLLLFFRNEDFRVLG
jgi:hypothetical protein